MAFDATRVGGKMAAAFLESIGSGYANIRDYAKVEFAHLSRWFAMLIRQYEAGKVSGDQARILVRMQRASIRNVFLTIEGLGLLAVEAALNAALEVVRKTVNTAIGFPLL